MNLQLNPQAPLDARLVQSVVNATMEVLATMAYTEAVFKGVRTESTEQPPHDISAVIGILGEGVEKGAFSISFPNKLADLIIARLLGINPEDIKEAERCDGVQELVNMISGNTKASLAQYGSSVYKLSLPTLVQGPNHKITQLGAETQVHLIIFAAEGELFSMQVMLKS